MSDSELVMMDAAALSGAIHSGELAHAYEQAANWTVSHLPALLGA